MTERNRRQTEQFPSKNDPRAQEFDSDLTSDEAQVLTEEELERANTGWRAEDDPTRPSVPSNVPEIDDARIDLDPATVEDRLDEAAEAIDEMAARERRREQTYRTGGDDLNPGFDSDIDSNAPKDAERAPKKGGGSRNQSDWN